jgi:hypothetical protein
MGSNKAGCFLEVAVFVEGGQKGVIRLPKGRGDWAWQRFVEELRLLIAQLVAKVLLAVPAVNAGVVGSPPSYLDVLAAPPRGLKSSFVGGGGGGGGEMSSDGGQRLLYGGDEDSGDGVSR